MPSTRSATSERPEENRQQLEEMAGTLQQESLTGHQMSWMTTIRDKLKREKESDSARRYRIGINDDGITTVSNIRDTVCQTADSFEVCLLFVVVVCILESTETKCTRKRRANINTAES
ncbi:hypothetical protein T06_4876 [Trichinella sp. T6]|nr:hypothetical protein T06_4876 [Trichinella sp. T6]